MKSNKLVFNNFFLIRHVQSLMARVEARIILLIRGVSTNDILIL